MSLSFSLRIFCYVELPNYNYLLIKQIVLHKEKIIKQYSASSSFTPKENWIKFKQIFI